MPDADVRVKRWGISYFSKNWSRYQAVLEADISRDGETIKCRSRSPETPTGAPTLNEMRAENGAELQRRLTELVTACAAELG